MTYHLRSVDNFISQVLDYNIAKIILIDFQVTIALFQ